MTSRQDLEDLAEKSVPQLNAWPEGKRKLPCLRCDALFLSVSKAHRICCGGKVDELPPSAERGWRTVRGRSIG